MPRAARLVLTEGNYLLVDDDRWTPVRRELAEVWFCDPDPEVRMAQLVARHVQFGKDPEHARAWVQAVWPLRPSSRCSPRSRTVQT